MNAPDDLQLPSDWEDDSEPDPRARRSRRFALIALGLAGVLVLGAVIAVGAYLNSLRSAYEKVTTVSISRGASDGERPEDGQGRNFLLLGSDKRSEEDAKAENVSGQRSDVMMLVHISADNKEAYVTSFPRDLYVDIPGHGKGRINSALAYGGVSLAVTTVENYTGVPVDHVALIDFEGIQGLVDTLDGVDVKVPEDFEADGHQYTEGTQHLNGEEALAFVRARKQFSEGDFQRNRNQQAVLQGIISKLISADTLTDPAKLRDTISTIAPYMTTDDGLDSGAMIELGLSLRSIRSGDIHYLAVPNSGPYTTSGGASVVGTDEEAMDLLRTALREDTMSSYYADHVSNG